jgi:hypothetical protein
MISYSRASAAAGWATWPGWLRFLVIVAATAPVNFLLCLATVITLMAEGELASKNYDGASPLVGLFAVFCVLLNGIALRGALRQAQKAEVWALMVAAVPGLLLALGWYLPALYRLLAN